MGEKAETAKSETTQGVKVTETGKRSAAKKVKSADKKTELKPEVTVQFEGREVELAGVVERIKALYVAEGHYQSSIKSLQVYIKPEENAAYYVINQKKAGKIDLF